LSYKIKLPEFEGPFDLLLFFIERDEVDIYDIPISSITNDFLAYLKQLEELNIDTASEFILVASTLMRIKSKMLLPRREIDDQGNEIDPRQELVERLLEYRRYKAVLDDLRALEKQRSEQHHRANLVYEIQEIANKVMADAELEELSLFKLLKAYETIVSNFEFRMEKTSHTVVQYQFSMEERREFLLKSLNTQKKLSFRTIFISCKNRMHAIFTFLALLELMQQELVALIDERGFNNFSVKATMPLQDAG